LRRRSPVFSASRWKAEKSADVTCISAFSLKNQPYYDKMIQKQKG
jgi:hypothetical protein